MHSRRPAVAVNVGRLIATRSLRNSMRTSHVRTVLLACALLTALQQQLNAAEALHSVTPDDSSTFDISVPDRVARGDSMPGIQYGIARPARRVPGPPPRELAQAPADAKPPTSPEEASVTIKGFKKRFPDAPGIVRTPGLLCLDLHDRLHEQKNLLAGSLYRELCRQALLIAARDELGMSTRDDALREGFPLSDTP